MGHSINFTSCKNDELKKHLKRVLATAYDPEETSSYHGNMTIHKDIICSSREEAEKKIEMLDKGWYDDHAVRYREGRRLYWLIKYEYHC